jgi:SWI/SNF-related matrix-associated actin-dependent regulator 1 of chromatin subfamily A
MNPDLELMPFQTKGADWLARSKRAMLCWEPGTGKTPTAVRAAVAVNAKRVLVFCPPIAVSVWRKHFEDWSNYVSIRALDASSAAKPFAFMQGEGVRIIPYSRLSRAGAGIVEAATRYEFDAIILDEIHNAKNPEAQRTMAVYGKRIDLVGTPLARAKHIWCLTGTPLLNHAAEFWTHLHALRPDLIILPQLGPKPMDYDLFVDRFCVVRQFAYGAIKIIGSKNTHELSERVKPLIDRKRIKDVILDLPELRIVEHALPADTFIARGLRKELDDAMRVAIETTGFDPEQMDDDELLSALQAGGVAFSTVRRLIGRAKVNGVAALVDDFLEDAEDAKLIVFAHHREVVRDLAEELRQYAPLVITGDTGLKSRDHAIELFQTDPKFRLIILAIEAAGEVITLHASHNVIIAEPSPVPMKNRQAIGRAYRKGQRHPVLARFVLLPGTLDARLMSIVARKTREIAQVVDSMPIAAQAVTVDFPDTV